MVPGESPCWKVWNNFSWSLGVIPGPVSSTSQTRFIPAILAIAIITVVVYYAAGRASYDAAQTRNEAMVLAGLAQEMRFDVMGVQQSFTEISAAQEANGLAKIADAPVSGRGK